MKQVSHGFTLIELLVVIFIIAVVVSAATIALGDNQAKRLEQKSQQLAAIIDLAKEQSIFNSEELGIVFTKDSYSFYRLTTQQQKDGKEITVWQSIENDKLLSKRTLPDGLEFELFLEGIKVNYSKKEKIKPQVFILSDGSITPFHARITDNIDHSHTLKVAENGEFEFNAVY